MSYRWDPVYPMGRRHTQAQDAAMRASDDERNAVAEKLSRHYAEGRLDEAEFKSRLDTAMSATTRGQLYGLFYDLPMLPIEPPPPAPRSHRALAIGLFVLAVFATGALLPFWPFFHVPWLLIFVVGFFFWRRARWRDAYQGHAYQSGGRRSVMDR